jgi:ribulose-5-phosphate 4-epimerase/fuculose-1-phosphate aldolase
VAVSVLADTDAGNALPPLTAYYAMRVGTLPMLPYYAPGDAALAQAVGRAARDHHALLLAHHGPVVSGRSLDAATDAIEELEATARLWLLVKSAGVRVLDASQVEELARRFPR